MVGMHSLKRLMDVQDCAGVITKNLQAAEQAEPFHFWKGVWITESLLGLNNFVVMLVVYSDVK